MKKHPEFQAERRRLIEKLAAQRQQIQADIDDFKSALQPLEIAKDVVQQAATSFRDNNLATQGTRLALSALPGQVLRRHPVLGVVAQIAVPLVLRHLPQIGAYLRQKTGEISTEEIKNTLQQTARNIRDIFKK
jgi:hypothetical protein